MLTPTPTSPSLTVYHHTCPQRSHCHNPDPYPLLPHAILASLDAVCMIFPMSASCTCSKMAHKESARRTHAKARDDRKNPSPRYAMYSEDLQSSSLCSTQPLGDSIISMCNHTRSVSTRLELVTPLPPSYASPLLLSLSLAAYSSSLGPSAAMRRSILDACGPVSSTCDQASKAKTICLTHCPSRSRRATGTPRHHLTCDRHPSEVERRARPFAAVHLSTPCHGLCATHPRNKW